MVMSSWMPRISCDGWFGFVFHPKSEIDSILHVRQGLEQAKILLLGEAVGHAGQVITDHAGQGVAAPLRVPARESLWHQSGMVHELFKQRPQDAAALVG